MKGVVLKAKNLILISTTISKEKIFHLVSPIFLMRKLRLKKVSNFPQVMNELVSGQVGTEGPEPRLPNLDPQTCAAHLCVLRNRPFLFWGLGWAL